MRPSPLNTADTLVALADLNQHTTLAWAIEDGTLQKTFRFHDFREAFAFMTRVAESAHALDHHPEWLNVYNRVQVRLITHDCQSLTELDFRLARSMDEAARTAPRTASH
jgi:4a-hydroxytetrahydrobiopterin dehydratase